MLSTPIKKVLVTLILIVSIPCAMFSAGGDTYKKQFLELWEELHDPANGYFSKDGAPYHCIETLMVEAPDHGHQSTSEAYSYYIWLEAMYGKLTGDWSYLEKAWNIMEAQIIPTHDMQPSNAQYDNKKPSSYAAEYDDPTKYPTQLYFETYGIDPLSPELTETYGNSDIYQMHWLLDCDNFYGYGNFGDGTSTPSYINTYQRGCEESVWETIPHPSWEDFTWGGNNGYLDIFTIDNSYSKQWRYTSASDADARVVQAIYWAYEAAKEQGLDPDTAFKNKDGDPLVGLASKMGDYLRMTMFDKFFKPIGCQDVNAAGKDRDSMHYLLSWYMGWGGSHPSAQYGWAWRQSCSHSHFGYQNPVAAWALSTQDDFIPQSPTAETDWTKSYKRQVELYRYLQSDEGAIAGGVTNSYNGDYSPYPMGTSTFYDMAYVENPVYADPGSNTWFGMQAWSMERMCELYFLTNDDLVKEVVDKWVTWIVENCVKADTDGSFLIPSKIDWEGQPDTWDPKNPGDNKNLHVEIKSWGKDLGIAGCLAKALVYYGAATARFANPSAPKVSDMTAQGKTAVAAAEFLLKSVWSYRDDKGVAVEETRGDYARFFTPPLAKDKIYIPDGWKGTMPNGDVIEPGINFIDIRSNYKNDPEFARLEQAVKKGEDFTITYHRFWAQTDVCLALADYYNFIESDNIPPYTDGGNKAPKIKITAPKDGAKIKKGKVVTITVDATDKDGTVESIVVSVDGKKIGTGSSVKWDTTNVALGKHVISATATDNDGATATAKITVTVSENAGLDVTATFKGNVWNTGFSGDVTLTNNSKETITGWTITWDWLNGEVITSNWSSTGGQSGTTATFSGLSWNGTIAPGASVSFGFQGTHKGTFKFPADDVVVTGK